jgi:phosphoglycerol transferase MdoB-like AlkP superfamily enzyme
MIKGSRDSIVLFIRLILFWMVAFFIERLVATLYFFNKLPSKSFFAILEIFSNSLRLDLSMAAYLISLPLVATFIFRLVNMKHWTKRFLLIYQIVFIVFFLLIGWVNLNLYREWGTKLSYKAINTFWEFPYEVTISGLSASLWAPAFIYVIAGYFLFKFYTYLHAKIDFDPIEGSRLIKSFIVIIILAFNFLFIRGGWQLSPINVSMAQYSNIPIYNHLSTNTLWQLMQNTMLELRPLKSQYSYFSEEKMNALLSKKEIIGSTVQVLKPGAVSPNVVLIVLESYTADLVESLGGEKGIAPHIEDLIKDGLLFTNIYSSAERTDKGLIAILSSFPSQATRSIIRENLKQVNLPSISQQFKKKNYHTSFYYGGESEFFGLKSYLLAHDYQVIVDKNAFQKKDFNSKWGAHDNVLFEKHLLDMKSALQPFFSTVLTLSNHEPFEIPTAPKYKGNGLSTLFRNTTYFTDSTLGSYFKEARKQTWYDNTLFVIVADHGHRLPRQQFEIWDSRRHRIPLIFYGNVLKDEYRGTKNNIYGSQTDIAQSLYNQLGIPVAPTIWSNDLLRSNQKDGYAFFDWDNGFGLVGEGFSLSYNEDAKRLIEFNSTDTSIKKDEKLNFAKAYMQKIFSEYLKY